jgi:hypothetical protein
MVISKNFNGKIKKYGNSFVVRIPSFLIRAGIIEKEKIYNFIFKPMFQMERMENVEKKKDL